MTNRFEDRLLVELRGVVAARPAPEPAPTPARRRRAPLVLAGTGLAAAAGVAAIFVSGGAPSAYAVESGPNGAVTVEIRSLSDAAGLERKLRAAGIPAEVDYSPAVCAPIPPADANAVPATGPQFRAESGTGESVPTLTTGGATSRGGEPSLSGPGPEPGAGTRGKVTSRVSGSSGTRGEISTFTLDPGSIPAGQKVYITTAGGGDGPSSIAMAIGTERPTLPCGG